MALNKIRTNKAPMTFVELDFSYNNPVLAPLADLEAPEGKNTLDIRLKDLPSTMAEPMSLVYEALLGEEAKEDDTAFRLVFKDGRLPKLYSPALYRKNDNLAIRWGNNVVELAVGKNTLKTEALENVDIEFSFIETKIGKYSEASLSVILNDYKGYDEIVMPFTVKKVNYEEDFDIAKAKQYLKKGQASELCDLFAELKTGSGGSVTGDVYGNDVLPQGVDIELIKAVKRTTQYGDNYIFTARANADIGLLEDTNFWGFSKLKQKLNKGALINEKHPATLNFAKTINDAGDTRYVFDKLDVHWPETENSIKLTNLLANWS